MLCQNCHLNDAGVHLKRIVNGESAELHLCADCARALGYGNLFSGFAFPFASRAAQPLAGPDFSALGNRVVRCEVCGLSFDDIVRASRPGCPNCYRVFGDKLTPVIRKMHGRAKYQPAPKTSAAVPAATGEKWYKTASEHGDIVLGSTVTLTANVDGLPFPARLTPVQRNTLGRQILSALGEKTAGFTLADPARLYPYEVAALAERGLITPEFASSADGSLLAFSPDERLSVMLCDEDHIKIRAAVGGLAPEKAYAMAADLRAAVNAAMPLAVSPELGYLNQSPADLGTGCVPAVIVHLPVLSRTGKIPALSSIMGKLGVAVAPFGGSGLNVVGDLYRVSNTVALGLDVSEALSNLKSFCLQLETRERAAAEAYVRDLAAQDRISRAVSVLSGARLLTANEMSEMLSWIRLGAARGQCEFDLPTINELMLTLQPAGVNTLAGQKLPHEQRDEMRAAIVRKTLFPA